MESKNIVRENFLQALQDIVKRQAEKAYEKLEREQELRGNSMEDADPYDVTADILGEIIRVIDAREPEEEV